jgi:hypothetical protein
MRKSRLLLAGVAVAAAAAATSAFTASNTGVDNHVAGYDEATVSGATITSIDYVRNTTDAAIIDAIDFVATEDVHAQEAWLQFRDSNDDPEGAAIQCTVGTYTTSTPISCPMPVGKQIADVVGIGLTVAY